MMDRLHEQLLNDEVARAAASMASKIEPFSGDTTVGSHDAAPFVAVDQKLGFATGAIEAVMSGRAGLKDYLFAIRGASWAYAMRWLATAIFRLEAVDGGVPPSSKREIIARKLCLKLIPLFQFALKRRNQILYLHLCHLGVEELVQQFNNESLRRGDIGFRSAHNLLHVLAYLRGTQKRAGSGADSGKNS